MTDKGINDLCEGLSGFRQKFKDHKFEGKELIYAKRDFESWSKLKAFNLGDIKNIGNPSMKSIAENLFPALQDLCIWGNYMINSDGFLEICTARNWWLRRINRCGCYKISEDSGLWLSGGSNTCVINYNRVEDFGLPAPEYLSPSPFVRR